MFASEEWQIHPPRSEKKCQPPSLVPQICYPPQMFTYPPPPQTPCLNSIKQLLPKLKLKRGIYKVMYE